MKLLFAFVALVVSCSAVVASTETPVGFYTQYVAGEHELCASLETDHVVSRQEARDRGLPESRHKEFDNDPENQVQACLSINRSKQDSGPADFLRKSRDGVGKDYEIINWEEYLYIYYTVLHKYDLLRIGVAFNGGDLEKLAVTGNCSGCNLSAANLIGAQIDGADLTGTDFSYSDLVDANLTGANLSAANLSGADLTGANFTEANLTEADLSMTRLYGALLINANLTDADLRGANLFLADVSGASLRSADMTGASLESAQNISEAIFCDATMPDGTKNNSGCYHY